METKEKYLWKQCPLEFNLWEIWARKVLSFVQNWTKGIWRITTEKQSTATGEGKNPTVSQKIIPS